jgi:hypothetical protein
LHDLLEKGQQDGPDVSVTLTRTSTLLFAESPARTAAIADQVIARIKEYLTSAAGQPRAGPHPGSASSGLTALIHDGGPCSGPGMCVT